MSLTISDLTVGMKTSFSLYSAINGKTDFSGRIVSKIEGQYVPSTSNAATNHANIYPTLPASRTDEFEDSYSSYNYILIVEDDGTQQYIGLPWIQDATIVQLGNKRCTIVLYPYSLEDATAVKLLLQQHGYTVSSTTVTVAS